MRTFLRQDELESELSSLKTDLENIIAKIPTPNHSRYTHSAHLPRHSIPRSPWVHFTRHSRYAHSAHLPSYPIPGRPGDRFVPHEIHSRYPWGDSASEDIILFNPKPSADLRTQLAKTIDMPDRSDQVCEILPFLEKHQY